MEYFPIQYLISALSIPLCTLIFINITPNEFQITQLKINNNPYARAFRETIQGDLNGTERKGGHYREREVSHSPHHANQDRVGGRSRASSGSQRSPTSSPKRADTPSFNAGNKCTSNTSVESGKYLQQVGD